MTTTAQIAAVDPVVATAARRRRRPRASSLLAGGWLLLVVAAGLFATALAPYGPNQQDLTAILQPPTAAHLLGTDSLGRDVLSRLMIGAAPTLISVALASACYLLLGTVVGLVAGYCAGWVDRVAIGAVSVVIAMPGIIVMFVVLSIYRDNTYLAMTIFGILSSPVMVLLVRAATITLRNELFVDAARVSGLSSVAIVFRHVLPRIRTMIIVQASLFAANAVVLESAVSFLGFGRQPPDPTWGNMVSEAATQISLNPWMIYPTGAVVFLTALALGTIGDDLGSTLGRRWKASKLTPVRRAAVTAGASATRSTTDGATAPTPLLQVEGLSIGYHADGGVVPIVHDVSLTIDRGQILGLVGESGSGKTTVAFGVLGVVGRGVETTGGRVLFDGSDLAGLDDAALTRLRGSRIAYVAQEPMVALDPSFSVERQLVEAIRSNDPGCPAPQRAARVRELLELVEIHDPATVAKKYPHQLSGGMAQRVSIAFALAGRPELLVADEPTTALDVTVQAGILGLLLRLRDETGLSMLLITHDWGVVADVCDRVAVMYRGRLVEQASVARIFRDPRHPYTRALLASNPHGAPAGGDLPVISGDFSDEPLVEPDLGDLGASTATAGAAPGGPPPPLAAVVDPAVIDPAVIDPAASDVTTAPADDADDADGPVQPEADALSGSSRKKAR